MLRKTLVLDTSAIINQPNIFTLLENTHFVVPLEVLEELDNAKVKNDATGFNSRRAIRVIDEIRDGDDLIAGVEFGKGNILSVSTESNLALVPSIFAPSTDTKIISVAKKHSNEDFATTLVSADIAMRIKANAMGIESASDDEVLFGREDIVYSGCKVIDISPESMSEFYQVGFIICVSAGLYQNQSVILKSADSTSALGKVVGGKIVKLRGEQNVLGISAKNKEQRFAMEYLLDKDIPMVSIAGLSGSGKTILAIIAAMHMLEKNMYEKIVLCRPAVSMSTNVGALPGDLKAKLQPWIQPIFDNLKHAMKCSDTYLNLLMEKGKIEMESLSFIRGRTFPNTILIIDEAQNTTTSEMKAIITRMGENSKLIITGDLDQIDSPKLDIYSSGLSVVANKFKHSELAAHVTLQKTERSDLAALAAKLL